MIHLPHSSTNLVQRSKSDGGFQTDDKDNDASAGDQGGSKIIIHKDKH
jgi:hypothetical protein